MGKFYFRFQWFGVILAPIILTLAPMLLGITTLWSHPLIPYLAGFSIGTLLFAIAFITTQTQTITGKPFLSLRVATLLEATYATVLAVLLTSGSINSLNSNSALVSVLLDRGRTEIEAWFINDVTRVLLFILLFIFASTALISSLRERIALNHQNISRYEIVPILDPDD